MREALAGAAKGVLKLALALILGLTLLVVSYGSWIWWDTRQLRAFCDAVTPGTSFTQLASLAAQHGIAAHWVHGPGIYDGQTRDWVLFVPRSSTMGEVVCEIRSDQQQVTSARMDDADKPAS